MASQCQLARVRADRQQHQPFIACDIVDAVGRHSPVAVRGEVVIQHMHPAVGVRSARPKEIPQQFLVFRVDAQHGAAFALESFPQSTDVLELLVPLWEVAGSFVLHGLTHAQAQVLGKDGSHGVGADLKTSERQFLGDVARRAVGPEERLIDGRTGGVIGHGRGDRLDQAGLRDASFLAAPLFFGPGRLRRRPAVRPRPRHRDELCPRRSQTNTPRTASRRSPVFPLQPPHIVGDPSPKATRTMPPCAAR